MQHIILHGKIFWISMITCLTTCLLIVSPISNLGFLLCSRLRVNFVYIYHSIDISGNRETTRKVNSEVRCHFSYYTFVLSITCLKRRAFPVQF